MSVLMFIVNVNHCPGVLLPVLIMCPTPCPAAVFDIEKPMLTDKGCYKFMRDQKRRYLNQSHVYPITFLSGISSQSTLPTPHCFIRFFVSPLPLFSVFVSIILCLWVSGWLHHRLVRTTPECTQNILLPAAAPEVRALKPLVLIAFRGHGLQIETIPLKHGDRYWHNET